MRASNPMSTGHPVVEPLAGSGIAVEASQTKNATHLMAFSFGAPGGMEIMGWTPPISNGITVPKWRWKPTT